MALVADWTDADGTVHTNTYVRAEPTAIDGDGSITVHLTVMARRGGPVLHEREQTIEHGCTSVTPWLRAYDAVRSLPEFAGVSDA